MLIIGMESKCIDIAMKFNTVKWKWLIWLNKRGIETIRMQWVKFMITMSVIYVKSNGNKFIGKFLNLIPNKLSTNAKELIEWWWILRDKLTPLTD